MLGSCGREGRVIQRSDTRPSLDSLDLNGIDRAKSVGIGWERMGREKNGPKMSASANGSRLDERRVSGRAEVTVRCENSFESSPRLIVEEGRSSTGLLCRSCSPLFPSCSCYPNRKVAIAITFVQPEISNIMPRFIDIYRYLLRLFIRNPFYPPYFFFSVAFEKYVEFHSLYRANSLEIRFSDIRLKKKIREGTFSISIREISRNTITR